MEDKSYNGWANHATWNVALWINNDEGIYNFAKGCPDYYVFKESMREMSGDSAIGYQTPDGVSWSDSALDTHRLDELIREISGWESTEAEDEAERFAHTEECEEGNDYY
jgi:hypothetical protein